MDCTTIADRVAAYLDAELSRSERALYEAHLSGCADCQAIVERAAALDLTPPPPDPRTSQPGFWASMDQAISLELDRQQAAPRPEIRPGWLARLRQWELRVSFPVVAGYAALMALALFWSMTNLQRAQNAESTANDLSQQLEREQRQSAPLPATHVGQTETVAHVSSPRRVRY